MLTSCAAKVGMDESTLPSVVIPNMRTQADERVLREAFGKLYVGSSPTIGMFLYVAQGGERVLRVAFGKLFVGSSPTIGMWDF